MEVFYVTFAPNGREHFNIYYIFKEDKEQNTLSKHRALLLWENIILLSKPPTDFSP